MNHRDVPRLRLTPHHRVFRFHAPTTVLGAFLKEGHLHRVEFKDDLQSKRSFSHIAESGTSSPPLISCTVHHGSHLHNYSRLLSCLGFGVFLHISPFLRSVEENIDFSVVIWRNKKGLLLLFRVFTRSMFWFIFSCLYPVCVLQWENKSVYLGMFSPGVSVGLGSSSSFVGLRCMYGVEKRGGGKKNTGENGKGGG